MAKSLDGLIDHAQDWATRAEAFIIKNGWSLTDENRLSMIQTTATYLMHVDRLGVKLERVNCYVVHSQDKEWRFQTTDRKVAYERFKRYCNTERVAMFYWDNKSTCKRLFAGPGYTLSRDY